MKKLLAGDFHEAYGKSIKIERNRYGATGLDAKAGWLFDWLIKNKYVTPKKYKIVMRCCECRKDFPLSKWDGTLSYEKRDAPTGKGLPKSAGFVCSKCSRLKKKVVT